jgi:hypothetical protein
LLAKTGVEHRRDLELVFAIRLRHDLLAFTIDGEQPAGLQSVYGEERIPRSGIKFYGGGKSRARAVNCMIIYDGTKRSYLCIKLFGES